MKIFEINRQFYCENCATDKSTPISQKEINLMKLHPGWKVICENCEKVISTRGKWDLFVEFFEITQIMKFAQKNNLSSSPDDFEREDVQQIAKRHTPVEIRVVYLYQGRLALVVSEYNHAYGLLYIDDDLVEKFVQETESQK